MSKAKVTYETMCGDLANLLPVLKAKYDASVASWHKETGHVPGPHVIYGEVLNPYLVSLLESGSEWVQLRRVFDFLEHLATSEDKRVVDVVNATVLEYIHKDAKWVERARGYMGPTLLMMLESIIESWGPSGGG